MKLHKLINETREFVENWQNVHGIAPENTANAMDKVTLKNLFDMTETLKIWFDKQELSDGEKILAAINVSSLAEAWLRVFIIIHLRSYNKTEYFVNKKYDELNFNQLIDYFQKEKILNDADDELFEWLNSIRLLRNTVHLCSKNKVYDGFDLKKDFDLLCKLIDMLTNQIPDL